MRISVLISINFINLQPSCRVNFYIIALLNNNFNRWCTRLFATLQRAKNFFWAFGSRFSCRTCWVRIQPRTEVTEKLVSILFKNCGRQFLIYFSIYSFYKTLICSGLLDDTKKYYFNSF